MTSMMKFWVKKFEIDLSYLFLGFIDNFVIKLSRAKDMLLQLQKNNTYIKIQVKLCQMIWEIINLLQLVAFGE